MPEDTTIRSDDAAIFPGATIMQCEERASSSLRAGQMRFILTPPEQGGKLYLEISDPDQTVAKALATGDLSSIPFEMRDFDTGEQRRVALRNVIKFGSYHEGVGGERGWWGKKELKAFPEQERSIQMLLLLAVRDTSAEAPTPEPEVKADANGDAGQPAATTAAALGV